MPGDRCDLLCLDLEVAEALRGRRVERAVADRAARRAGALADGTRLTLAAALGEAGELCVCDLAWVVERSQNLVSHHLGVLHAEGLVDARREGRMAIYSLTGAGERLLGAVLGHDLAVTR